MPYHWTPSKEAPQRLELWPYRSLPRRGFALIILMAFGLIIVPLFPLLGTVLLWGLLPFLMLAVAALWWALERSYKDADILEELTFAEEALHLVHRDPKGNRKEWECNPYWARAEMHQTGGPVPWYVTLTGNGRRVEIGAFLSEEERRTLYGELAEALKARRQSDPSAQA